MSLAAHEDVVSDDLAPPPLPLGRVERWAPLAAVAIVCVLPFWGLWRAPGPPMEEGFMLAFPEMVLKGLVPNRDFLHLYGPGSLWVLAAVYKVLGVSLAVERSVGFMQNAAAAFGVFVLLRPWGRWVAAAGGAVAVVIVMPPIGLTALAWMGGVALAEWALVAGLAAGASPMGSRRRHRLAAVAGGLAAAALLYRPDLVLAVGLSMGVVASILDRRARRWLAASCGAGLCLYVVHIAIAGAGNVFRGLFVQPVFDLRGGRRLPLPPSWTHFDGFLQKAGDLVAPRWPLPAPPSPAQLSLWLGLLVAADLVLVVAGVRAARRGDRRLLAMALLAAGLLAQALQRADTTHLAWASCVPLGLLPAGIIELLGERRWTPGRRRLVGAATPAVLLLVLVPHFTYRTYGDYVAQSVGLHRDVHTIRSGHRVFYYGRADAVAAVDQMLPVVKQVSRPGDRLFVGTGDLRKTPYSEAFLYYLLPDLTPATRYVEMDPGVANAPGSGLDRDLASANVVILSSIRDDWVEPNDSRNVGSDAAVGVLQREFCKVGSFGAGLFGRGLYELYTRC